MLGSAPATSKDILLHTNNGKGEITSGASFESDRERDTHTAGFAERVRAEQQKCTVELKPHYNFIVC